MPPKHESHRSSKKPKGILKHRKHAAPKPAEAADAAVAAAAGEELPATEAAAASPPLASREKKSNDHDGAAAAVPTIRSNSKRACQLLMRIKEDQSPVASFFGVARLKGPALALHQLLKDEGEYVRTGERDIRRLFSGEPKQVRAALAQDAELPEKTVQAKTEFVSINSQFNKMVVTPLEKSFRNHGRGSAVDYEHLRKQAELLLGQAREARNSLKKAVREAKRRNSTSSVEAEAKQPADVVVVEHPQFKIPGGGSGHHKRRKRHSQARRKHV